MIVDKNRLWHSEPDGQVIISIGFLDHGHRDRRDEVRKVAGEWEEAVPCVQFAWERNIDDCDVRISFYGSSSWSKIGNTALDVSDGDSPTMKLPWEGDKALRRRHIRHEFGHMLGAEHEQFSPDFPWDFRRDKVVKHFEREIRDEHSDWSPAKIKDKAKDRAKRDMLKRLDERDLIRSSFDDESVMLYAIKKEWLQDNPYDDEPEDLDENYHLSRRDKKYMRKAYRCSCRDPSPDPYPPVPPPNPVPYPGGFVYGGLPSNWRPIAPPPS